ncbi:unnamed protein product [Mesocestoides corti]|uniref:HSac2 domain-containing protein n=2 Tax=Mesocestoides corti TaxID=53468 RepID=A0A0R3UBP3_MESCO|nr:unnamed protein product [Mesocestoides corti]
MSITEVFKKIPTPQINLSNVQLPSFGKDSSNGKAPLNMSKEDMEQLINTIRHTTLATEDGAFVALWILTLIDHWNNEHERIVVLTERSFYIIRYDFLSGVIRESRRVGLGQLVSVTTGPLVFPTKSLMPYVAVDFIKPHLTKHINGMLLEIFKVTTVAFDLAIPKCEPSTRERCVLASSNPLAVNLSTGVHEL